MSSAVGARGSDAGQGGLGLQTVDVGGVSISVEQRDLSVEDFDECVDPCFFEQDYTVAASTGFHVWEGCWILVSELQGGTLSDVVRACMSCAGCWAKAFCWALCFIFVCTHCRFKSEISTFFLAYVGCLMVVACRSHRGRRSSCDCCVLMLSV